MAAGDMFAAFFKEMKHKSRLIDLAGWLVVQGIFAANDQWIKDESFGTLLAQDLGLVSLQGNTKL